MSKLHVVITGSNRGIGLALTKKYVERGDRVTALCRSPSAELKELDVNIVEGIDVTDPEGIKKAAAALSDRTVDVLINNAGQLKNEDLGDLDRDSIEQQFRVNAVGPLLLTEALQPSMREGSKVAMITSRMGSMADNGSGGYYGYRMSKAALNAAGVSLANDLQDHGIAVGMLHPGFVKTDMVDKQGDITPEDAAARLVQRIDELGLSNTGHFRHSNGESLPW
ncbi:SDR family oxidoreductase [Pseudidiomarina sp.]|uniref:SDR family oxidoreductase n=1 Tax=Pseudidiomarina sp. TaxID=2081707 RepID=UPI00299ED844|nr:SDR family oxidoreductase [Pseudidiomarina sp.]MDX1705092.1 SDR family oxidoreductase [Pseudidiomarina sp.]